MEETTNENLLKKQIEELEKQVSTLKRHNEILNQENLNNELNKNNLSDFESKIQQLQREKENILRSNEELTKEKRSLQKKNEELEVLKTKLKEENKVLRNNSFEKKYNDLRTFIQKSLESYSFHNNQIQTTISNIKNALD